MRMDKYEFKQFIFEIDIDKLNRIIRYGNYKNWNPYEDLKIWVQRYFDIEIIEND